MHTETGCSTLHAKIDRFRSITASNRPREIAFVLTEGFSLLDLGLVSEVFQQAQLAQNVELPMGRVTLLSSRGGYISDPLSLSMRTDAIHEHYTRGFDSVFVLGGSEGTVVLDPSIIGPLRELLSNACVVQWNAPGWRLVEATGYRIDTSDGEASTSKSLCSLDPARSDLRFAGRNISAPLTSALSFMPRVVGIEIARRITRHVTSPEAGFSGGSFDASDEVDTTHRVRKAGQWARENFTRAISVAQVAEVAGMSERNFLRHFKIDTGMSPSEYLMNVRLEMTCDLLEKTTLPVDKIARRCGLGSGEGLSRIFRRRLFLTPTEYRAGHRSYAASLKT